MSLSRRDEAVLDFLCNPHTPSPSSALHTAEVASRVHEAECSTAQQEVIQHAKAREFEAVQLAENGSVDAAIEVLSGVIEAAPTWVSAYNNRAQALQMTGRAAEAERDLDTAIELYERFMNGSAEERDMLPVCPTVAEKAYTHRALLRGTRGDAAGSEQDMKAAAALGSRIAKQRLAADNPYAKLCSSMVTMMMEKEMTKGST